ncbi:MAG: hypothetical protein ACREJ1_07580 [Candidatus Methylomirabilales bacterium]
MPSFHYLARDQFGVLKAGSVDTDGLEAAVAQLDDEGLFLFEIEEERRREERRREERRREDRRKDEQRKQDQRKQDRRMQDRRMQDRRLEDRRMGDRRQEERRTEFGLAGHALTACQDVDVEGPELSHA